MSGQRDSPDEATALHHSITDYYSRTFESPEGNSRFHNLDDSTTFNAFFEDLRRVQTQNFVLDFGADHAYAARDLSAEEVAAVLKTPRPPTLPTRWINIWGPESQKPHIKAVAGHYDFSARLQGLMCSDPAPVVDSHDPDSLYADDDDSDLQKQPVNRHVRDIEKAHALAMVSSKKNAERLPTHYHIVNDIWQSFSVDYGHRYDCIGYNSLYTVKDVVFSTNMSIPDCKRVWTWLVLCDDETVITIHENPFPLSPPNTMDADSNNGKTVNAIRKNVFNIFQQISKAQKEANQNATMTLQVRQLRSGAENAGQNSRDAPSLLLYYIFDDWYSAYNLVAQKGHQYEVKLEKLRKSMFERPAVELVEELHLLGRQLSVLKRVYGSYVLIIDRLLQRQRGLRDEARSRGKPLTRGLSRKHSSDHLGLPKDPYASRLFDSEEPLGVPLSSTAVVRFERLRDRINLYALSQIEECLNEKESLTFLTFNLIALKESQAVERLTRVTILLAKATILFLPVSLMTGYFSVQIDDLAGVYTVKTYWVCFAVIMVLSVVVLIIFGWLSGTIEGKPIFKSFSRTFFDASKSKVDQRRKKNR